METKFTRVGLALLLERENICLAGPSGPARSPVLLTWIAGAGSGTGTGAAPPAIKMAFGGEFPEGEEGVSPLYIRAHGAKAGTSGTARAPVRLTSMLGTG